MTRMSSEFREKLEAIAEFSKRYLEKTGRTPILVGGQALDVYMLGERATQEIDMLAREDRAAGILKEMGFTQVDRNFVRRTESSGIYFELLGEQEINDDSEATERVLEIDIDGTGDKVFRIIAPEDLVLDRLSACEHRKYSDDRLWAEVLLRNGLSGRYGDFDIGYIRRKASDPRYDVLANFEEIVARTGETIQTDGPDTASGGASGHRGEST